MQSAQRTRWSRRPHGVRKQWTVFSMPRQRKSECTAHQWGGGMPTSKKEEGRSGETNGEDGTRRRPAGRRQSSSSLFGSPRAKCGGITCKTFGKPRYGEQHDTQTSSGHDRGGLDRERMQASKHIIREGGDAEAWNLCPKWWRPVLRTTSSRKRIYMHYWAMRWASLPISVGQECTGTRQAVFWCHMAAPEVGWREDREADEGGISHGKTPRGMEPG